MKSAQNTEYQAYLLAEKRYFIFIQEELYNAKQRNLMKNAHIHI